MTLERAVRAPRVHHQWLPDHLSWEELSLSADVRQALEAMGHRFAPKSMGIGRCQAIAVEPDGTRVAVCDHRSGGSAGSY